MDSAEAIDAPCDPTQYRALTRIASNPDNFFTVGFGGGSLPGLAANCALSVMLEELDLLRHVKEVWGTSAGSIAGAALSMGISGHTVLEFAARLEENGVDIPIWEVVIKGLFRWMRTRELPEGVVRGRKFRQTLDDGFTAETFQECELPLFMITCTDDGRAQKIILDRGNILDAISASMCIPGVMFPVPDWNGQPFGYLDGGLVEKTPLLSIIEQHARSARPQQLVILCTHYDDSGRIAPPRGFLQRIIKSIDRLEEVVWEHQLKKAAEAPDCKFLVLNPRMEVGGMFDFELLRFNYLWSRQRFKEQLSNAQLASLFSAR